MITLERKIYPVGQGLFCSEILKDGEEIIHAIVYDCGSECRKILGSQIAELKETLHGHAIDAIFVSHFHADHINGLESLMDDIKIKMVFLPKLDPYQIVRSYYESRDDYNISIDSLIEKVIFSRTEKSNNNEGKTRYIEVPPFVDMPNLGDYFDALGMQDDDIIRYLHYVKNKKSDYKRFIYSDFSIQFPIRKHCIEGRNERVPLLEYIPFNIVDEKSLRFNYSFLYKYKKYIDYPDCIVGLLREKESRRTIIDLYRSIFKDLNESSMPVLSHLIQEDSSDACLYTGDYSHKIDKDCHLLKSYYGDEWSSIKTIQVPHHGSRLDNPIDLYLGGTYHCVVSYGLNNRYGHPDIVTIQNIKFLEKNNILYKITEQSRPFIDDVKIYLIPQVNIYGTAKE